MGLKLLSAFLRSVGGGPGLNSDRRVSGMVETRLLKRVVACLDVRWAPRHELHGCTGFPALVKAAQALAFGIVYNRDEKP